MKVRFLPLLLAAALAVPWPGRAVTSPFGPAPAVVEPAPPRLPTDPNRWLPWRLFTWRDGVQPGNPALAQDLQGYIWADGPIRYNGRTWQKIAIPGEAFPVRSWSLLAASDGSLWFGRVEGGLLRLRNGVWKRFAPGSGVPAGLVGALVEDGQGALWVGTSGGLARCRGDLCVEEKALRGESVRGLAVTRTANGRPALWIGTSRGLLRLDGIDRPSPTLSPRFDDRAALPDPSIRDLVETTGAPGGARVLWVATDNGVARLRDGVWTRYEARSGFPPGPMVKLAVSHSAQGRPIVWAGSFRSGVIRFEEDGRWAVYDTRSGLPVNLVFNLLLTPGAPGREPTLWAATPAGLARLEPEHWNAIDARLGLPNEVVISLGESAFPDGLDTYWIGTVGGMIRLTPKGWQPFSISPAEPTVALSALGTREEDGTPAFWVGSVDGLHRFAHGSWTSFTTENSPLPHNWIVSLLEAPSGTGSALWAATPQGLARLERGRWTAFRPGSSGLPGNQPRTLARTPLPNGGSVIWAGTERGVGRFQGEIWEKVAVPCLPNPVVLALRPALDPGGGGWLWIGTREGVARLGLDAQGRPRGECQALTAKTLPALPQPLVNRIQIDGWGRIYLFTDWGVSRLTVAPGRGLETARVEPFDAGDGLPGMDFNASFVDHLGRVWGGATGGAAVLDPAPPELAVPSRQPAPLRLEHILVAGRERSLAAGTALRHDENSVEFQYALLSYRREHATRYQTQLVGLEDHRSPWTAEARVVYTRLPEGEYTFRVWGMDGKGALSAPIEIPFRIRPAPWLADWALALYAAALIGLGYGASHVRTLARRAATLETEVAERTRELAAANHQLELVSLTDPLTGLNNRRFLGVNIEPDARQAIRSALEAGAAPERNVDLIFYFLDVDHFKQLNDRAGHAAGDQVLVEIAGRLREAARDTDAVLRWGGEEFLIVSRWTDRRTGEALAERLLDAVAGAPFAIGPGASARVTCSVGWAPYPWRRESPEAVHYEQVMSLADRALYLAKREGRNQAVGVLPGPDGTPVPEGPLEEHEGISIRLVRSMGLAETGAGATGARKLAPAGSKAYR